MKRIVPSFFFLFFINFFLLKGQLCAQTGTIKGSISDTINHVNLKNSTVSLLRKTDSVLVTFTRSDPSGSFVLKPVAKGEFILFITHPGFAVYTDDVQLNEAENKDLGAIMLTPMSKLLEEIIIKKTIPAIQVKGDTLIYKADSFQVQKGASVEELLKKLPGLQVDKNGQITAQGERVQKVLVDGEEFFSDDPTIATKNLMADMVEDVQVFDKKSDQAEFTGIDDGQKQKTINLKLKEDKKKGYFGKLELGSDFNDYWNNNAMINSFKGKQKMAAYGIMSNTGKTGLDWRESMNYGGMSNNVQTGVDEDGGGMYISISNNDEFDGGRYWGEGLPKSLGGGFHYSNKWLEDKNHLALNYRYGKISNEAYSTTKTQYILPDTLYYYNQVGNSFATRFRHKIDGLYEYQIDSSTSIKWTGYGTIGQSNTESETYTESLSEENLPVNNSKRKTTAGGNNKTLNNTLLLRKKFKRQGQTLSINLVQDYKENDNDGYLYAENNFYDAKGDTINNELIDQQKKNKNETLTFSGRITYTQPLSKKSFLVFNYGLNGSRQRSTRTTLEKSGNDSKYDLIVEPLSNDFEYKTLMNTGGINYRFVQNKKMNFSLGGSVSQNQLDQKDLIRDTTIRYSYVNFFPRASFNYTLKGNKNIRFNYNGSTRQPSISQLQPILDNNDPLNIYIGNPDLRVSLNHRFNASFNMYNLLSNYGFWGYVSYDFTQHDFSTRDVVDSLGRHIYQTVNVDGNYSIYSYMSYFFQLKKLGLDFNAGLDLNKNRRINFINGEENVTNSFSGGPNIGIRYSKEKKFSIGLNSSFSYNFSRSSIREDVTTNYWTQDHNIDLKVFLPWKFEFNTDVGFNLRQKTDVFERDNNYTSWNASIDRKLFKNDVAKIRLYAYDILDQNRGVRRDINTNFISEHTYNTVRRYFMLSFIWNFSKNGKPMDF